MTGWQHAAGVDALNLQTIYQAEQLIAPHIHCTPVLTSRGINELVGAKLYFKCENLQRTGAFKFRGACHALLQLNSEQRKAGVYTVSSGNHGAALACAGEKLGIPVHVGVPKNAPRVKKQNMQRYHAKITELELGMAARDAFVEEQQQHSREIFIPPYNHPTIIAGQATASLELIKAVPDLNALVAPVGGGGLLAGTCMVGHSQDIPVFGAEPVNVNDAWESLQKGAIQKEKGLKSICDGLLTRLGEYPFEVIQSFVKDILCITEEEIVEAMYLIWQELKVVIEPSSATVLAAVIKHKAQFQKQRIGLIISGGNVDIARLPWHVDKLESPHET
ncbi:MULTISPECIES: threonine/serine dehydratase [Gammaproteobacteria]|uniref:threonine ammonia-lyase n=1 Tax=Gammaproteobacteria TaxID=1236 RepID=UPI000DD06844|nr:MULTISPECIES: pyridoxal-phosphate dependent enzyme [Gammaproteobacteria]RTE86522.1 pyridoxal-phosphate dependent enzyme [Aliidiomarina sp. B3213]TCZ90923.1 pyridoxal-phosphate dependent enzyme [Lysobacter sp. N42]